MSSTNETLAAIAGDLKTVYGEELVETFPDAAILQKRFPLADSAGFPRVGDYYSALIGLQLPWGVSFLGNGTENQPTNSTLGDVLAGQTKPAQVYACTSVLADNITYQALDRASGNNSEQSVLSAMAYTGKQMALSLRNINEFALLHGRQGLGAASAGISTLTVTLDPATTSPGILSTLIGARLQWMQADLTSARTANSTSNYLTVSAIDLSDAANPTLTMVATGTTNVAAITTGDVMFIAGSRGISVASSDVSVPFYEQIGLGKQLNDKTGTLFGIDKGAFVGWVATQVASVGQFSPSVLMDAASRIMARGGELGKYVAVVSPRAWGVLNASLATQEMYMNGGTVSKKSGTDDITVKNGGIEIEVLPHPFQKDGSCFLFPESQLKRIGSVDMTFEMPGTSGEFYLPIAGQAVVQRQCRSDWQVFLQKPSSGAILTGISY